jgi:hypothetical protein
MSKHRTRPHGIKSASRRRPTQDDPRPDPGYVQHLMQLLAFRATRYLDLQVRTLSRGRTEVKPSVQVLHLVLSEGDVGFLVPCASASTCPDRKWSSPCLKRPVHRSGPSVPGIAWSASIPPMSIMRLIQPPCLSRASSSARRWSTP